MSERTIWRTAPMRNSHWLFRRIIENPSTETLQRNIEGSYVYSSTPSRPLEITSSTLSYLPGKSNALSASSTEYYAPLGASQSSVFNTTYGKVVDCNLVHESTPEPVPHREAPKANENDNVKLRKRRWLCLWITLLILVLLAMTATLIGWCLLKNIEAPSLAFEDYVKENNIKFTSLEEEAEKKKNFEENVKGIDEHNEKADKEFEMEIHKDFILVDVKTFEDNYLLTTMHCDVPDNSDKYDNPIMTTYVINEASLPPVRDQGSCGSCWAASLTDSISFFSRVQSKDPRQFSIQQLIDCVPGDCHGGDFITAYEELKALGGKLATEQEYPYEEMNVTTSNRPKRACNYEAIKRSDPVVSGHIFKIGPGDETQLFEALRNGPVIAPVKADHSWRFYRSGFLGKVPADRNVNHAVLIVGHSVDNGVPYWIIRNSWGTAWGDKGYGKMIRGHNISNIASCAVQVANRSIAYILVYVVLKVVIRHNEQYKTASIVYGLTEHKDWIEQNKWIRECSAPIFLLIADGPGPDSFRTVKRARSWLFELKCKGKSTAFSQKFTGSAIMFKSTLKEEKLYNDNQIEAIKIKADLKGVGYVHDHFLMISLSISSNEDPVRRLFGEVHASDKSFQWWTTDDKICEGKKLEVSSLYPPMIDLYCYNSIQQSIHLSEELKHPLPI